VTSFVSTNDMSGDNNSFGMYFAEIITSVLLDNVKNVRLIERTRLDAITKENSLSLSGLISENDARKVGELLPIDYILTGTYTLLGTELMINARFVNVVTGEITFSKNDQLHIPDELKAMFPVMSKQNSGSPELSGSSVTSDAGKKIDECMEIKNRIFDKAGSTGPSQYTQVLIKEGINVPFDTRCGSVHLRIIDHCVKNYVNIQDYTYFLSKCADTMNSSFGDYRGESIMRYFAADSMLTPDEWKSSLKILSKIDYSPFGNSIKSLVYYEDKLSMIQKERCTELFKQCAAGQIGKRPIGVARLLNDIIDITGAKFIHPNSMYGKPSEGSDRSRFESLQTQLDLAAPFLADTAANVQVYQLHTAWNNCTDATVKQQIFVLLCKKMALVKQLREDDFRYLVTLAGDLADTAFANDELVIRQNAPVFKQMAMLGESCKVLLEQYLERETVYTNQFHDLIPFCLYSGIEADGVPSVDTLKYWLAGEDSKMKKEACKYIMYMGKRAAPLESNIIRAIRKGILTKPQPVFDASLIKALGALGTNTEETRTLLVDCLAKNDPGYIVNRPIIIAVAQCGPSVVPLVKKYFEGDNWNRFYETLEIVKIMGKDASALFTPLLSFANSCGNQRYKYEAQETIDAIRNKN
ncbi:MAG: FlgO family outer membrane protein, partial [Fibrobacterota bacterium]|nr:FlgO family outer membrane protein [Chitinispirillaceae bacterium]